MSRKRPKSNRGVPRNLNDIRREEQEEQEKQAILMQQQARMAVETEPKKLFAGFIAKAVEHSNQQAAEQAKSRVAIDFVDQTLDNALKAEERKQFEATQNTARDAISDQEKIARSNFAASLPSLFRGIKKQVNPNETAQQTSARHVREIDARNKIYEIIEKAGQNPHQTTPAAATQIPQSRARSPFAKPEPVRTPSPIKGFDDCDKQPTSPLRAAGFTAQSKHVDPKKQPEATTSWISSFNPFGE